MYCTYIVFVIVLYMYLFTVEAGAMRLLELYTGLLCSHVADILPLACSLAGYSVQHFIAVSNIIKSDVTGNIFTIINIISMLLYFKTVILIPGTGFCIFLQLDEIGGKCNFIDTGSVFPYHT